MMFNRISIAVLVLAYLPIRPLFAEDPPKYVGTELTDKAPYEWRDGAKLHFFKGKYWLLGGWTVGPRKSWGGDATTNEIWTSTDLINWKLEVPHIHFKVTEGPDAL